MDKKAKASLRVADAKLRSIVAYAKANAKAALRKDEAETWQAHAKEVDLVSKMLRGIIDVGAPAPLTVSDAGVHPSCQGKSEE